MTFFNKQMEILKMLDIFLFLFSKNRLILRELTLEDAYGDGICCRWGQGFVTLSYGGEELDAYRLASYQ